MLGRLDMGTVGHLYQDEVRDGEEQQRLVVSVTLEHEKGLLTAGGSVARL